MKPLPALRAPSPRWRGARGDDCRVTKPGLRGIGLATVLLENPPHLGDDLGVGLDADVGRGDDRLGGGSFEVGARISNEAVGDRLFG